MGTQVARDLVALVPGKDEAAALTGILSRPEALGIRAVEATFQRHPDHDAGCLLRAHDFLRRECGRFQHALVMFDHEGCGSEARPREALEQEVEQRLSRNGWGDRASVVVVEPELEIWVWTHSPIVERELGWSERAPGLWEHLRAHGYLAPRQTKPQRPKEAVEEALRLARKPRSSFLYQRLASKVTLAKCVDPAFVKLRATLQRWFGEMAT